MNVKGLMTAEFIEAYELTDGKYRNHQCIGTFKIEDKHEWFDTDTKGNIVLTDVAWAEIEKKGLKYNNKKWLTFDLLTSKEVKDKIKNEQNMVNFYSNRLTKLVELVN